MRLLALVTLAWLVSGTGRAWAWREVNKTCAPGCETTGNCNREFGTCECPFGWTGPACETLLFPACRSSASPKALPFIGVSHPKACECWVQLHKYAWDDLRKVAFLNSVSRWAAFKYCYERKGLTPEQQYSDPPLVTDPDIRWRRAGALELSSPRFIDLTPKEVPKALLFSQDRNPGPPSHPMDDCPDRCNERGSCVNKHCQCMQGFSGSSCNEQDPKGTGCMNNCTARGACIAGFCHCTPGWWGMDCSRSKAYEAEPNKPLEVNGTAYSRTKLRIYRYELPWNVAFRFGPDDCEFDFNMLYGAFDVFFNLFSNDTMTRTENPHEANLFYIPGLVFFKDDNAGDVFEYTRRIMNFIQETYPQFWGRNQGRDHFIWLPGDLGACWLLDEPAVQNPIKVVHWGLQINASEYTRMPHYHWVKQQPVNKEYHCFKMEKDVVAPCWLDDHLLHKEITRAELVYKEALAGQQRRYLLFFGGSIRHQQFEYSGGARQAFDIHVVSKKHPEIAFGGGPEKYREATFCLAPYGDGWGSRIVHIMQGGCIPVIVQEYVHQPLDDVLIYEEFSLRLKVADIPYLMEILRSVPPEQIQRYREKMHAVYKAFHWLPEHGGLAYNYTLLSLRKKLFNLWGEHYHRRKDYHR